MKTAEQEVRAGKTYEVHYRRIVRREDLAEGARHAADPGQPEESPQSAPGVLRFYDAGTRMDRAARGYGDEFNVFRSLSFEGGLNTTPHELFTYAQAMEMVTNPDTPARYLYSDRPLYAQCAPIPATSELDGHALGVTVRALPTALRPTATERHWELFEAAPWVRRMAGASVLSAGLARLAGAVAPDSRQDYLAAVENAAALDREQFDGPTAVRAQRDASAVLPLTDGVHQIAVTSGPSYCPFEMWNEAKYKVTAWPSYAAEPIEWKLPIGQQQTGDVRVFLVPQRHLIYFAWYSIYTFVSVFASSGIQVFIPMTRVFADRLPYYPYPYAFADAGDQPSNDTAMSLHIRDTQTFASAFKQSISAGFNFGFVALVWERNVAGRWTVLRGREYEGELRGIVEYRLPSGARKRAYVWNKIATPLVRNLIGYGSLDLAPYVYPKIRGVSEYTFDPPGLLPVA